jgi:hypothetical protein
MPHTDREDREDRFIKMDRDREVHAPLREIPHKKILEGHDRSGKSLRKKK